jgi:hypothetical protein
LKSVDEKYVFFDQKYRFGRKKLEAFAWAIS